MLLHFQKSYGNETSNRAGPSEAESRRVGPACVTVTVTVTLSVTGTVTVTSECYHDATVTRMPRHSAAARATVNDTES